MSEELQMYRKYDSFVKRSLVIAGICPRTRERNIFYRCISIWSIVSCSVSMCAVGNTCLRSVQSIGLLAVSFPVFASILNVVAKICCFTVHQKKLGEVNDILDFLLEEASKEPRARSVLFLCLGAFYRMTRIQTVLMAITAVNYAAKPAIKRILADGKNATGMQYALPLTSTYPWIIDSTLVWQLHYLLDVNALWFIFCVSTGVDTFFGFCMFRMSAILRLLAFEFESNLSRPGEHRQNEENRRLRFALCIDRHVLLIKCRDMVQQAYGPAILLVTVTNAMGMCTIIFQTVQMSEISVGKIAPLVVYLLLKIIQTFLYGWSGEVVLSESEFFRTEVYFSSWYEEESLSFARSFSLVMAQRSIVLKACDLMQISLDLFAKILNTTISYYFLLKTFDGEK